MFWRMWLIMAVVGSLLVGCRKQSETANMTPLRSNVIFALEENGQVRLSMWTTEIFPCLNYDLRSDFRQTGRRVEVAIKGIVPPTTCVGKEGPARFVRSLGSMSFGTYELIIKSQRHTDRYNIRVARNEIEINPVQQSFTDYWK